MNENETRIGTVKFWHDQKGYSFIIDDETKKEYYTYRKNLAEGVTRLTGNIEEGIIEKVTFELKDHSGKDRKQIHAINVKPIN